MITDTISQKIATALKERDETKVSTYRLLSSALNYEFIARQHKLTDEEEWGIVGREIKKRKEAIEALRQAQGKRTNSSISIEERIKKEEEEMKILNKFLPEQLTDAEIEKLIDDAVSKTNASQISDMGKVIGMVMGQVKGKADGSKVSQLVRNKLSK